jgi:hypothetical protein
MTRSDWISLIAATGTLLGLIPAYRLYFAGKKSRKPKRTAKNETSRPEPVPDDGEIDAEKPMGPYARAAALTAMAFVIFVIELVAYSWLANLFKVKVDLDTMPLNWAVGFWILFLVPGLFCLLALINIVSTMSD